MNITLSNMISFSNSYISKASVHKVGNEPMEEDLIISSSETKFQKIEEMAKLLISLTHPFKDGLKYEFLDPGENLVYINCKEIFLNPESLHFKSIILAKFLHECSIEASIKGGEFIVLYISDILIDDEIKDAIGLYKLENPSAFVNLEQLENEFIMSITNGFSSSKIEKACFIINNGSDLGFDVIIPKCLRDQRMKHHWLREFLNVDQTRDEYYQTDRVFNLCKQFAEEHISDSDKLERISMIQETMEYLKDHDSFSMPEYEQTVIRQPEIIDAFQEFREHQQGDDEGIPNEFNISPQAVSFNRKYLRSILKLDKNFHVYVHGSRENIIRGFDPERKQYYYQLFFENEK